MPRTAIKELSAAAVGVTPLDFDWSEGWTEAWDFHDAERCEKCGKVVYTGSGGEETHAEMDDNSNCEGYVPRSEGPMMNYYYPLPEWRYSKLSTQDAAEALVDLPVCLVEIGDEYGLALTGGGMDLSWEICEAFMLLGYLPPLHFASDLSHMAGLTLNTRTRWILGGCTATARVMVKRAQWGIVKVRQLRAAMQKATE